MSRVYSNFLGSQRGEALALANASDLVEVYPYDLQHYLVRLHCRSLVKQDDGAIVEADCFDVGIHFSDNYLREVDPSVLMLLWPLDVFHPNVRGPAMCAGRINPGTPLVELVYRAFDLLTGHNVTFDERDALNHEACRWARQNLHRFPFDDRPLKYRRTAADAQVTA